ncbi:hypothetical protein QBC44DRAFT_166295 [Cladorrhinum sp. PSN332]|nr:hypothetical protein QBC44DRAFT_166295 [Cladorrhinum sp. PSN332]
MVNGYFGGGGGGLQRCFRNTQKKKKDLKSGGKACRWRMAYLRVDAGLWISRILLSELVFFLLMGSFSSSFLVSVSWACCLLVFEFPCACLSCIAGWCIALVGLEAVGFLFFRSLWVFSFMIWTFPKGLFVRLNLGALFYFPCRKQGGVVVYTWVSLASIPPSFHFTLSFS